MAKRVKRGGTERPNAFADVPQELERWARGEAPAREQEARSATRRRASVPAARRVRSAAASDTLRSMQRAMPGSIGGIAATAAVAIGAALIEVELLPGILLGAGALALGSALPRLRAGARPILKSAIAAGWDAYDRSRSAMGSMAGQVRDTVAQARHDVDSKARSAASSTRRRARGAGSNARKQAAAAAAGALPEAAAESV